MTDSFKQGDSVYVGTPTPQKVHWEVLFTSNQGVHAWAMLSSPMSGRRRRALLSKLTLHTKGSPA